MSYGHISHDREFFVGGDWKRNEDKNVEVWETLKVTYVRNDHGIVAFPGVSKITDELIDQAIITIGE
jgi:hypothetical protein